MRPDGRKANELRPVTLELNPIKYPAGSAIIRWGGTHVLCTVSIEDKVPPWMAGKGKGWLTAEYALLPGSASSRIPRSHIEQGRAQEIRRLIGRSLRHAVNLEYVGERTFTVDCDVLQADGGTRTASVTGAYVAVALAIHRLAQQGQLPIDALLPPITAVSVGLVEGQVLTDLAYIEDSAADMDLNVVMDASDNFIEVQGTAEGKPVPRTTLDVLLDLASQGIADLRQVQQEALLCAGITR